MTILEATKVFCKQLQKTNFRNQVKEVFDNFESSKKDQLLDPIAGVLSKQFLGYLFAIQRCCEEQSHFTVSTEATNLLKEAHGFVLKVNSSIYPLRDFMVNAHDAINPYSDYEYALSNFDLSISALEGVEQCLNSLEEEFKYCFSHEAIFGNFVDLDKAFQSIAESDLTNAASSFHKKICSYYSSSHNIKDLEVELFNENNLQLFCFEKLIRNLIVIRDAIYNIDQMIYQAIRYKKPAILSKDNIFNHGIHANRLGETFYLDVQPVDREAYLRTGELVYVSLNMEDLMKDGFYRIESMNITDSSDFGQSIKFALRAVDDSMTCYPDLLID